MIRNWLGIRLPPDPDASAHRRTGRGCDEFGRGGES
jgi:hypothetical protein